MGSENLWDSTSYAEDSEAVQSADENHAVVRGLRIVRDAKTFTVIGPSGVLITLKNKRKKFGMADRPEFNMVVTRYQDEAVKNAERISEEAASESIFAEEAEAEVAEAAQAAEEVTEQNVEVTEQPVAEAGFPAETVEDEEVRIVVEEPVKEEPAKEEPILLLAPPKEELPEVIALGAATEIVEETVSEIQFVTDDSIQIISSEAESTTNVEHLGTVAAPEQVFAETCSLAASPMCVPLPSFEAEVPEFEAEAPKFEAEVIDYSDFEEADQFDYEALYEDLAKDIVMREVLLDVVPELFDPDYVEDDTDYEAVYEDLEAEAVVKLMEEIVPEVFEADYDPNQIKDDTDYEAIYEDLEAEAVVKLMEAIVPEVFEADYDPNQVKDDTDYAEIYENLEAESVIAAMEAVVPEVFDPNYGKFVPEYVISEIAEPVVESTVIEVPEKFVPEYVISEIEGPVEEITTIEIPEKFVPEYVISEIAEPVVESTVIEVPEKFVPEYVITEFDIATEEVTTIVVPEKFVPEYVITEFDFATEEVTTINVPQKFVPEYVITEADFGTVEPTVIQVPVEEPEVVAPCEDVCERNVTTVTTFKFAFATTSSPGKTGFSFIMGKPAKGAEEFADDSERAEIKSEQSDNTVYAKPFNSGTLM